MHVLDSLYRIFMNDARLAMALHLSGVATNAATRDFVLNPDAFISESDSSSWVTFHLRTPYLAFIDSMNVMIQRTEDNKYLLIQPENELPILIEPLGTPDAQLREPVLGTWTIHHSEIIPRTFTPRNTGELRPLHPGWNVGNLTRTEWAKKHFLALRLAQMQFRMFHPLLLTVKREHYPGIPSKI